MTALENRHGDKASRRGRIRSVAVDNEGVDLAVVVFPAVNGVAHGGEGVHVPFVPHVV